jgi:aquaporin Z
MGANQAQEINKDIDARHDHPARAYLAEFVGTFALVFVAAGGSVAAAQNAQIGLVTKAVAPGLIVMALIYSAGQVSGMHINPAVTIMFALRRVFPLKRVPTYLVAQILGAVTAAFVVRSLFGSEHSIGSTLPAVATGRAFGIEVVLTSLLLLVIVGTSTKSHIIGPDAALAVGGTIALCGLVAEPLTGASMNPARSLGPALVSGDTDQVWIYIAAPLLASVVVVALSASLFVRKTNDEEEAAQGKPGE